MIKKNGVMILWVIVFLAGCMNLPMSNHPLASPTFISQNTLTHAATLPPETRFTRQCLPVDDREVELDEVTSGTIFLRRMVPNILPPGDTLFTLKNMQTGSEYLLPKSTKTSLFLGMQISSSRKMLAALESIYVEKAGIPGGVKAGNVLWVFDAQAKIITKMDLHWNDYLFGIFWLDDERLLIETAEYGKLLLVNPFSGEQQLVADELPHLSQYVKDGLWWPVVYSPDLEWVVYDSEDSQMIGPVVYNLVTKQILWHSTFGAGSDVVWSPDGQEIAFSNSTEINDEYQLYLISRSGQVKTVLGQDQPHRAFAPSWSPDGRYIAFWNDDNLAVYDRRVDWVFDTCIRGYGGGGYGTPYWSPDSQQIIVYGYSNPTVPVLVDWQKKVGYKIKNDLTDTILGWMNSLP